jgi:hypothetical protein
MDARCQVDVPINRKHCSRIKKIICSALSGRDKHYPQDPGKKYTANYPAPQGGYFFVDSDKK